MTSKVVEKIPSAGLLTVEFRTNTIVFGQTCPSMGLMDKLTGADGTEEDNQDETDEGPGGEMYRPDDLSDEVMVWFLDPWPENKPLKEYGLIFLVDSEVAKPIILQCERPLMVPEGTGIIRYNEVASMAWEETTFHMTHGMLVNPDIIEITGEDQFKDAPKPFMGKVIGRQESKDPEMIDTFASFLTAAVNQDLQKDAE